MNTFNGIGVAFSPQLGMLGLQGPYLLNVRGTSNIVFIIIVVIISIIMTLFHFANVLVNQYRRSAQRFAMLRLLFSSSYKSTHTQSTLISNDDPSFSIMTVILSSSPYHHLAPPPVPAAFMHLLGPFLCSFSCARATHSESQKPALSF